MNVVNGFTKSILSIVVVVLVSVGSVLADPLAETREVLFSGTELADKAAELGSPAKIYEYVRNTEEYALYHGSRSNSTNTFLGARGSDVDIASVLIAMYRSQGIPARYAVGTVSIPAGDVANWQGVHDATLAISMMNDQGIQGVQLLSGNVSFEHTWVQVQVPFGDDYRGAFNTGVNCSTSPDRCHWVDLDPSYKLRKFNSSAIDVYGLNLFNYTKYYNAIKDNDAAYRDKSPLAIYKEQILNYLRINHPGKTLQDVSDAGTIIPVNSGILPASLPYSVVGAINTFDDIASHDVVAGNKVWAKYITLETIMDLGGFTLRAGGGYKISMADLSTKRLTLTFVPQTGGQPGQVHVRLDGVTLFTPITIGAVINGQTVAIGTPFSVLATMDGAPATVVGDIDHKISAQYDSLVVGGYYLVGTGGDTSNWSQVHRAAKQLLEANAQYNVITNPAAAAPCTDVPCINGVPLLNSPDAMDDLTGGLLYVAMSQYFTRFVEDTRTLNELNHVASPIEGFIGILSSTYQVDYLDNTAFSVMPGGLLIDMKGLSINGNWRTNAPSTYANEHFKLLGHIGSSLEHEIWQALTGFDAVSTVRGIQMAVANGAALMDLKKFGGSDTTTNMYSDFGYTALAPSPFQLVNRTVFTTTQPQTWSHTTPASNQKFDILKKFPTSVSDARMPSLQYSSSFWDGNINCFDTNESAIRTHITAGQGNTAVGAANAGTYCGAVFISTTTWNAALALLQTEYNGYKATYPAYFDYLDKAQGFIPTEFAFHGLAPEGSCPANAACKIHDTARVQQIRNDVLFGATATEEGGGSYHVNYQYIMPGKKIDTGFNLFSVYIVEMFNDTTSELISLGFKISNDSFAAGGGWVDAGAGAVTLSAANSITGTSIVKPVFNNTLFTDQSLVSQTNNDLIRTPSTSDPVSTVTGNMYHDETDFTIKGRGLNYTFTRSYNSAPARANQDGPLGFGWTHSYGMSLRSNDYGACPNCAAGTGAGKDPLNGNNKTSSLSYIDERGGEHTYVLNPTDSGTRTVASKPPGEFDTLQLNTPAAGQYTLLFRNGTKYVFKTPVGVTDLKINPNQTAVLDYIQDPYGNKLTMGYDASNRLIAVTDNLAITGRTGLLLTYHGATQHIQSISDWTGRTWSFAYDGAGGAGNLQSATNAAQAAKTYAYIPGTHLLSGITLPENRSGKQVSTTFVYYRNNKAFYYTNTLGHTELLDYDLYQQSTQVTDPRGFVRQYFYDKDNGGLTKLVEPDGAILQFANNADGLRYSKIDGLGYQTQYSYQTNRSIPYALTPSTVSNNYGLVSRETDANGKNTDYSYSASYYDQPTVTTDKRLNATTRNYYTATNIANGTIAGKLQNVTAKVNGVANTLLVTYTYYADSAQKNYGQLYQKIEMIDPAAATRKRITTYVYESDNGINLQSVTVAGATSGGSATTVFTYDSLGRVKSETLSRRTSATDATMINVTTSYDYDDLDRVTTVTNPRGDKAVTVYDANGKVSQQQVQYKQPDTSFVTRTVLNNTYDAADRILSTTDVLNNITHFTYDANGNVLTKTDANAHTTRYEYDGLNRQTAIVDANGRRVEKTYDLAGNLVRLKNANGEITTFTYDKLGRQTQVASNQNRRTQFAYDDNGNLIKVLDANLVANSSHPHNTNLSTVYNTYDELNRKKTEVDALNGTTTYIYDLLGNVTRITDAVGQATNFVYDDLGRLVQTKDPIIETPDKTDQVTLYDEAGNALTTTDRSGRQRRYTYDVMNRVLAVDYLMDGQQDNFTYDAFGDLTQIANADTTYNYQYTARHEMKSKTDTRLNKSLLWTYDNVGNLATKTDYQGEVTQYQYDSTDKLVAEQNAGYLQVSYHYDGAGRLINRILSNGAQTDYHYDADGRLDSLKNSTANGTLVSNLTYVRDEVGNIKQVTDSVPNKTVNYTYDGDYRLLTVVSTTASENRTYTYDLVGNRKTLLQGGTTYFYTYNPAGYASAALGNRLQNIRTGSGTGALYRQFTYDDNGRMLTKKDGSGAAIYTVTYNGKGRPVQIVAGANSNNYAYDANDYRIHKADSQGQKLYHLEGEHLEATYNTSGQLLDKYLRGAVIDEVVNGYHYTQPGNMQAWKNYSFHHDLLNSVTGLSDPAGGIEESTGFDAFGAPLALNATTGNDLLYTGRELDRDTGLYYYRARYYDPELGRFISEDPKGFAAGINFYAYVNNNPINANDPSGQITQNQFLGGARVAGGLGETAVGGTIAFGSAGFGVAAGAAIAAHGIDQILAGYQQMAADAYVSSFTSQGLQHVGFSPLAANLTDAGLSLASGGFSIFQGMNSLAVHSADPLAAGLNTFQILNRVEAGSAALNFADFTALGGNATSAIAKANMMTRGVDSMGGIYTGTTSFASRIGISATELYNTGLTPLGNFSMGAFSVGGGGANAGGGFAGGGFVVYPNKANNNMMRSVYAK